MLFQANLKIQFLCIVSLLALQLLGQSEKVRAQTMVNTQVQQLQRLSAEWKLRDSANYAVAQAKAREMGWPLEISEEGFYAKLDRLTPSGQPMYHATYNTNAAISVQANQLHSTGGSGLNLNGSGMTIAQWDGGLVLTSHEQLNGRVSQLDGATSLSSHATHVAGTLIGNGSGNATAKGMAPQASLQAYDFNSDYSEMAAAAAGGLLVSNHSYGYIAGWYGNQWWGDTLQSFKEDRGFGAYYVSQWWDSLTYLAPYYLIVKSAGNDRNDNPVADGANFKFGSSSLGFVYNSSNPKRSPEADGGADRYESIPWQGNAKNILTVGAVYDVITYNSAADVGMSSFSAWGPTDDGRIKPDLVGNGVNLTSASSSANNAYSGSSGTSMSSPNVAGALLLLQEYYINTHGSPMKASSLKALAIHTARECGASTGPDYQFGWGLLSAKDAADVISADTLHGSSIQELSLGHGGTISQKIISDGTPLRLTICWTDPPAVGTDLFNNRSPRLIHDLDMSLSDGQSNFSPYRLDPANPAQAATTGDNDLDNVEQVYLANPVAGQVYTLNINHEGSLRHSQDFALIISGHVSGFYTAARCSSGCDASQLSNWNSSPTGNGVALGDFNAADLLVVQSSHTGSLSANWTPANTNLLLKVENGGQLNIDSTYSLQLAGGIYNQGLVQIATGASLVQSSLGDKNLGSGEYQVTRNTGTLANHLHYQYWASPVDTASMNWVFQGANSTDFYQYNPGLGWQSPGAAMEPGRGYATTPTVNALNINFNENRNFNGRINNGTINYLLSAESEEFILAGNPYPSAISADSFVAHNPGIKGALYFFNQTTSITDAADYAIWNSLGAVQGGRDGEMPDDYIQSCQGFFVQASGSLNQIIFRNSARVIGNNTQFFKANTTGAQRLWLKAESDSASSQLLLGFTPQATTTEDRLWDARSLRANPRLNFYSFIKNKAYGIQARPWPAQAFERVGLGIDAARAGQYAIGLDSLHQWPQNRQIWLWDSLLNKYQDLRLGEYSFSLSKPDTLQKRFFIEFGELTVGKPSATLKFREIQTFQRGEFLHIYLNEELAVSALTLSALSGKTILHQEVNAPTAEIALNIAAFKTGIYILQLRTANGEILRQKVYLSVQ